jgi:hypothetical protein
MKWKNNMSKKQELLKKCGRIEQIAGYRKVQFTEGRAKGVEAVEVYNAVGLRFTVLIGRNLDIADCSFNGINVAYMTSNGITSPYFHEKQGDEWLRTFSGGLLTTCGLTNAGASCFDEGDNLGVHGRIGSCPAEEVCCKGEWIEDDYIITISGNMYETKLFGYNLKLHREIKMSAFENKISIYDSIENIGIRKSPIMIIYHCNFGYPLVDLGSVITISSRNSIPTSEESKAKISEQYVVTMPEKNAIENVYFHVMEEAEYGYAAIKNASGLSANVKFDLKELPYMNQWKMLGCGEYVVGLEPSNCMTLGRDKERHRGTLKFIKEGETKNYYIEFDFECK